MAQNAEKRLELPSGYFYFDAEEAAEFREELQRELPPGHLLYGVTVECFRGAPRKGRCAFSAS